MFLFIKVLSQYCSFGAWKIDNREIDFVKWNKTQFFLPADDVTPCRNKGYLLVCSMHYHENLVFRRGPTCINQPCISYGKRQKSCTLIVILVKCLYLTSPIFNSSAKSNRTFYLPGEEVDSTYYQCYSIIFVLILNWILYYFNYYLQQPL